MNHENMDHFPGLGDKRVVITGAGSGIGLVIAELLLVSGCRVAICDVDADALDLAMRQLPGIFSRAADVTRDEQVSGLFEAVAGEFGGLDILINNAGTAGPTASVEDIEADDWRRCIDVCLTGQFLCAHHAVPMIKAAGGGSIINMSSVAGKHGYAFRTPYSSAKFGVIGFTQSLAKELGGYNIRVNAILPGVVEGKRIQSVISARAQKKGIPYEEMVKEYLAITSMGQMVSPWDVARMIAFLVSEAGRYLSGQSIAVDANVETL